MSLHLNIDRCKCGQPKSSVASICSACIARQEDDQPRRTWAERWGFAILVTIVAALCLLGKAWDEPIDTKVLAEDRAATAVTARDEWSLRMLDQQRGETPR